MAAPGKRASLSPNYVSHFCTPCRLPSDASQGLVGQTVSISFHHSTRLVDHAQPLSYRRSHLQGAPGHLLLEAAGPAVPPVRKLPARLWELSYPLSPQNPSPNRDDAMSGQTVPARRSRTSPPRSSSPRCAPREEATSTAVGAARPRAHGQATTRTSTASFRASRAAEGELAAATTPGNSVVPAKGETQQMMGTEA